jgi:predicted N-acetyltransferase YhbS
MRKHFASGGSSALTLSARYLEHSDIRSMALWMRMSCTKNQQDRIDGQCMNHKILDRNSREEVSSLFTSVFTASAGEKEGRLIGNLASELSSGIDNQEIIGFGTYQEESIIASIFFSRLRFRDAIQVYMLAPVAVSTEHQGKGVGQALINYALNELKKRSVAVAITYGDPAFYSKVGFRVLSEKVIQAPMKLSMPEGWLGQSLTGERIPTIGERPKCVEAFHDPAYW